MKNSLNIVLAILFLVVLGCSCPKLNELTNSSNSAPSAPSPVQTPYSQSSSRTPSKRQSPAQIAPSQQQSPPSGDLKLEIYNQIQTNMAKSDVEKLLNGPGIKITNASGGGVSYEVRKWQNADYKTIIITFKNDRVYSKTQVGLE
jgi:hypothetical protein